MSGYSQESQTGMVAQWIVFAIMTAAACSFGIAVHFRPQSVKLPYYVNIAICTVAAVAYYAMAVNYKNTHASTPDRQVVYARYLDWILTTPLLLLDLVLMTNMGPVMITWIMGADIFMVVFGILGAFEDEHKYKWVYFIFGCIMQVVLSWGLLNVTFREELKKKDYQSSYLVLFIYLTILWIGYPIVWAFGSGGNVISVDLEAILMGILDILAKPIFGMLCLVAHETIYAQSFVAEKEGLVETGVAATATVTA